EQKMVVRSTGEYVHSLRDTGLGERLGVLDDATRIVTETGLARLPQCDGFRGEDVWQRTAEHDRTTLVDRLGELGRAQNHPAAGTAQRLMRRRRHDMSERHRVVVPVEDAAGHKPCEMRHVDHEHGPDLVGDLAELREVDLSRVRAVSREEHEGLYLTGLPTNLVEIEQHRR